MLCLLRKKMRRISCYLVNMRVIKVSVVLLVSDLLRKLLNIILILTKLYGDKLYMDKLCEGKL